MKMNLAQQIIIIGMVVLGTVITRFLPFIIFSSDKPMPKFMQYLGKALPSAALGILVIYCYKNTSLFSGHHAIPELIATAIVAILYLWKKQILLSIAGGTICYMVLVQTVFQ